MFDSVSDGLVRSIWGGPFVEWEELGDNGSAGGILVLCERRVLGNKAPGRDLILSFVSFIM